MKRKKRTGRYLLLAAFLVSVAVPVIRHQLKSRDYIQALAPGVMLEAVNLHHRGLFRNTRVLLLGYSAAGATGVVVGEPLQDGLDRYPEAPALDSGALPQADLFWGGPVALNDAYRLLQDPGGVSFTMVTPHVPLTEGLLPGIYHGYAGWSPGQLENEIRQGSWQVKALSGSQRLALLQ